MGLQLESYHTYLLLLTIMVTISIAECANSTHKFSNAAGDVSVSSPENLNTKLHLLPTTVPSLLAQRMIKSGPVMEIQGNERKVTNQPLIDSVLDFQNKSTSTDNDQLQQYSQLNQPRSLQMAQGSLDLQSIIDSVMNKKPEPTAQPNVPFDISPKIIYHDSVRHHSKRNKDHRRLTSSIGSVTYPYGPPASVAPNFLPPTVFNVDYSNKDVRKKVANAVQIRDPATRPYFSTLVDADIIGSGILAMSSFTDSNKELKRIQDKIQLAENKLKSTKILAAEANTQMILRINKLQDLLRSFNEIS